MPVIAMISPWIHPKTGVLWFRAKVPKDLQAVAGRNEVKWTLGTKDKAVAAKRWPQDLQKWEAMKADWRRELDKVSLAPDRAREIAAGWSAWIASGAILDRTGVAVPKPGEPWDAFNARVEAHSEEALRLADISVTKETRPFLVDALGPVVMAAYQDAIAKERAAAEGLPAVVNVFPMLRAAYPKVETPAMPGEAPDGSATALDAIWEAWSKVTPAGPRTVHETKGILKQLGTFLGHDSAAQVSKADLIRWRDALKAEGKSNNTWNNRLSLIGQVFKRAVADDVLPADPTLGLRLEKSQGKPRYPYTDEDTISILQAARKETKPSLRWAHWVMALSGMRVGEVLQLTGNDVAQDQRSGVWFMAVKHAPNEGKIVKNSLPRNVPIHPRLIEEGFLAHAMSIKEALGDAPLFPDKKPDRYGHRGGRAWNVVGKWIRDTVGITDKEKAPDHSWRHRMEDELRAAEVDESIRDAIIGHARKTVGRQYGVQGEALARLHRELSKVKLPKSLSTSASDMRGIP